MKLATGALAGGWALMGATLVTTIYVTVAAEVFYIGVILAGILVVGGAADYLISRPTARRPVWHCAKIQEVIVRFVDAPAMEAEAGYEDAVADLEMALSPC